jgi:hypothetical protein
MTVSPDADRYPQGNRRISGDVAKPDSGLLMSPDMGGCLHARPFPHSARTPGAR